MKSRTPRRIAVLVTGAVMALSFPVASSVANPGGVPNDPNNKQCPSKGTGAKKPALNSKGKKCGSKK